MRSLRSRVLAALAVTALSLGVVGVAGAATPNQASNPSFELPKLADSDAAILGTGTVLGRPCTSSLKCWQVTAGEAAVVRKPYDGGHGAWTPKGAQVVELRSVPAGEITQTVSVTPFTDYTLTYFAGANPDLPGFNAQLHAEVRDCSSGCEAATVLDERTDTVLSSGNGASLHWTKVTLTFNSETANTVGVVMSNSAPVVEQGFFGPLVDGVTMKKTARVTPNPNLIGNPGFELPKLADAEIAVFGASTLLDTCAPNVRCWKVTAGEVALVARPYNGGHGAWVPKSGRQTVELRSVPVGEITQVVAVTPNTAYRTSVWAGASPDLPGFNAVLRAKLVGCSSPASCDGTATVLAEDTATILSSGDGAHLGWKLLTVAADSGSYPYVGIVLSNDAPIPEQGFFGPLVDAVAFRAA